MVRGFYAYFAVPTNLKALAGPCAHVGILWIKALRRRSQKDKTPWDKLTRIADQLATEAASSIPGHRPASASNTQGGSRMP